MLSVCSLTSFAQNYYSLRGYVTNKKAEPLVGVYVRVADLGVGTVTNEEGQYELNLIEGIHRVSLTYIGYKTKRLDIVVQSNTSQNVRLEVDENKLKTVEISNKKKDLSYEIIKKVIENKAKYQEQFITQKRSIYVKSKENNTYLKKEKNKDSELEEENAYPFSKTDSIPKYNLFEGEFVQHIQKPKGFKEEKIAAKKYGNQRSLFFTTTTEANFDFNQNLIFCKKLGDNSYISPISNSALLAYKYRLIGSKFEKGKKIYKIKVIPRKMGNALFKGTIEVWDSLFAIKSVQLQVNKNSLVLYEKFSIAQDYAFIEDKHLCINELYTWEIKTNSVKTEGECTVIYDKYLFDSLYAKRFFNAEIGTTKEDAYEKDTAYWDDIRPLPLTDDECAFMQYQDSLMRLRTSKVYLDSIDSVFNKITWIKALWEGFGIINREKKTLLTFDPAIGLLDPVAIGGFRLRYSASYFKKFENRKAIRISPFLNYGFRNQDVKGNIGVWHLYDPKKQSSFSINAGNYFGFVNNFATISDIFNRNNFFEESYLSIYHRTELFNGFYLGTGLRNTIRKDLGDFKFNPEFDEVFENNKAQTFDTHSAAILNIRVSYTPQQLYIQEPKEKIILGSRFPTFRLNYRQGLDNLFGSSAIFKTLDFSISQKFNIGIIGSSEYNINLGGFLDTSSIRIMDYRYQRGGDPFLLIPPMFGYQLIDSTFPTFRAVLETHYTHQFNGFLTSKIPGLKQSGIRTMVGGGLLYVPESNYQYSELLTGINRIFKIGRERLKIGIYYIVAQSNVQGFTSGFKFSLNPYNADTSTWSF